MYLYIYIYIDICLAAYGKIKHFKCIIMCYVLTLNVLTIFNKTSNSDKSYEWMRGNNFTF